MANEFYRNIVYYKHYLDFFNKQNDAVKLKFNWTLGIIATLERVLENFFKHIEDGIFEIRVEVGNNIFRVFSFFDEGKLVIMINAFQKKTQKTPKNEIALAKKLKKEYFDEKSKR